MAMNMNLNMTVNKFNYKGTSLLHYAPIHKTHVEDGTRNKNYIVKTPFLWNQYANYAQDPSKVKDGEILDLKIPLDYSKDGELTSNIFKDHIHMIEEYVKNNFDTIYHEKSKVYAKNQPEMLKVNINRGTESVKAKLRTAPIPYYNGTRLVGRNRGAVNDAKFEEKDGAFITVDNKKVKVLLRDIEFRNELDVQVLTHDWNRDFAPEEIKPAFECTNEELVKFYGEPKEHYVHSMDEFREIYDKSGFSWIRYELHIKQLWASKAKPETGFAIVCNKMEIVPRPYEKKQVGAQRPKAFMNPEDDPAAMLAAYRKTATTSSVSQPDVDVDHEENNHNEDQDDEEEKVVVKPKGKPVKKEVSEDDESEDDEPVVPKSKGKPVKKVESDEDEDDSDDDVPIKGKAKATATKTKGRK